MWIDFNGKTYHFWCVVDMYLGITGRPKYIDKNGDAYADITVVALKIDENKTEGYLMNPVATIKIANITPVTSLPFRQPILYIISLKG